MMSRKGLIHWRGKWEQQQRQCAERFEYAMYMYAAGQVDAADLILAGIRGAAVHRIPYDHFAEFQFDRKTPAPLFPDCECTTCGPECACGPQERVIRRIIRGDYPHGAMTVEQRAWCIAEADSAGEGAYKPEEMAQHTDQELAATVLRAWTDYVRSNCGGVA